MFSCLLVCEGLSNDDVGVARGTVFQEMRAGAGFKTGDFFKEKLGGYRRTTHDNSIETDERHVNPRPLELTTCQVRSDISGSFFQGLRRPGGYHVRRFERCCYLVYGFLP